eukprot:224466-Rhodomonas_salina.1
MASEGGVMASRQRGSEREERRDDLGVAPEDTLVLQLLLQRLHSPLPTPQPRQIRGLATPHAIHAPLSAGTHKPRERQHRSDAVPELVLESKGESWFDVGLHVRWSGGGGLEG